MKFSHDVKVICMTCWTIWNAVCLVGADNPVHGRHKTEATLSRHASGHPWGKKGLEAGDEKLTIVNDGPTILGANTTYYATLSPDLAEMKVTCYWEEWKCGHLLPYHYVSSVNANQCNITSRYRCSQDLGDHEMFLVVLQRASQQPVAEITSGVTITEYINTKFTIKQGGIVCNSSTSKCLVTTKNSMQMTVNIHDPSNFFNDSSFEYAWSFGDGDSEISSKNVTSHNYSSIGVYEVQVNITAFMPDKTKRYGRVTYTVQSLDGISNLTMNGTTATTVGSSAQFNVTCNGSMPVSFCWSMTHHNTPFNGSYIENSTCMWALYSTSCNDSFRYKFNTSGTYHLRVQAVNDVSLKVSETKVINVKLANVAEYSSIAVALIFGIILSCISVIVVVYSYNKERMRHVEVANFDFQGTPERKNSSFSSFTQRLKTMVTHPPSSHDERLKILNKKEPFAKELDML